MDLTSSTFWIALSQQIGIMLVVFLVNFFILSNLVFKPTLKILALRHKRWSGLNEETKTLEERLTVKISEYHSLLEEARHVARMAREDILKQAEKEKQDILKKARADSEKQIALARQTIASDTASARQQLKTNAQDLAREIVTKILGKKAA